MRRPTVNRTCEERVRLLECYKKAVKAHSLAVSALYEHLHTVTQADYAVLSDAVEEANKIVCMMRTQLEHHIEQHRC